MKFTHWLEFYKKYEPKVCLLQIADDYTQQIIKYTQAIHVTDIETLKLHLELCNMNKKILLITDVNKFRLLKILENDYENVYFILTTMTLPNDTLQTRCTCFYITDKHENQTFRNIARSILHKSIYNQYLLNQFDLIHDICLAYEKRLTNEETATQLLKIIEHHANEIKN